MRPETYGDGSSIFETLPDKDMDSDKKPKRRFVIKKAQSQYVNIDDFLKF